MEAGAVSFLRWLTGGLSLLASVLFSVNAEPLSVIVSPVPVFSEETQDGELRGYTVSLIRGVLSEAGLEDSIRPEPFARMLADLKKNPNQLGASVVRTPQRESQYHWIMPVTATPNQLYIKKESVFARSGVSSLNQLSSIAVMRDDYRHELLRQANVSGVLAVNSWEQAIGTLLRDRVEGVLFSSAGVRLVCAQALMDCDELIPAYTTGTPVSYLVLPKTEGSEALALALTQAAERFRQTPAFRQLADEVQDKLTAFGLIARTDDGVLYLSDSRSIDKAEHIWVLGELSGDFAKLNSRQELVGYNADLVRALLLEADVDAPLLAVPWQRLIRESLQKPNVLAFTVARTPEREELFHWITPVTRNSYGLFGLDDETWETIDDIPKAKVTGTIKRDFRSDIARKAGLPVVEFDSWREVVDALHQGDIDLAFASPGAMDHGCRQSAAGCKNIQLATRHSDVTTWVVLSKSGTDPALVEKFTEAASRLKQSEKYLQWAERWARDINRRSNTRYSVRDGIMYLYSIDKTQ